MQKPIGIFGGTFDPIHLGHLDIASAVIEKTPIDKIIFIPCYQPVHRDPPESSPQDRMAMIELAINTFPQFSLDDREIKRRSPSFMIDTLISLRRDYGSNPLCLILGSDAYLNIEKWKRWQELLDFAHILVINRPFFNFGMHPNTWLEEHEATNERLTTHLSGNVVFLKIPPIAISATEIRQKIKQGQDIKDWVPKGVAEYIKTHYLYG